jgi:hypothetical protein
MKTFIEPQGQSRLSIDDLMCLDTAQSVLRKGNDAYIKFRTDMPTIYTQPKKNKQGTPSIEKEKIAEECLQLKCTVNNLNRELVYFKSEVHKREKELNNKNKVIQDIYYDTQNNYLKLDSSSRTFQKLQNNSLYENMKRQYKELKNEFKQKEIELEELKRNVKLTKIKEIQNEAIVYMDELRKMKALYEISSQHSADYE